MATISAPDGHTFDAYEAGDGDKAIVVIQEIFGADAMVPMTLEGLSRGMRALTR